jgi:hypothetical protein
MATARLLGRTTGATGSIEEISVGTGLTFSGGSLTASSGLNVGTAASSTSGTVVEYLNIPSGTKRITVLLSGVGYDSTSARFIQIGDSGGFETSGYTGGAWASTAASASATSTAAFLYSYPFNQTGASTYQGAVVLHNISGNTWVAFGTVSESSYTIGASMGGTKTLSGTLDRVRVTSSAPDNFDAGTINIFYE